MPTLNALPWIGNTATIGNIVAAAAPVMTRPANTTAYAANRLVANSTTAGSVVPLVFAGILRAPGACSFIRRAKIIKSSTSVSLANFRLHLFAAAPTVANGDGGVFSPSSVANALGRMDVVVDQAYADGAFGTGVPVVGTEILVAPSSGTETRVWGLLESLLAYTPASGETFTVSLEAFRC